MENLLVQMEIGNWENSNKKKGIEIFKNGNIFKGDYKMIIFVLEI